MIERRPLPEGALEAYMKERYIPINEELRRLREHSEDRGIPVILRETEALLLSLLYISKPANILEIGTAVGYSSACFAEACPHAGVVTIESNQKACKEAAYNLKALGLEDRVRIIEGDATIVMEELIASVAKPFDFIFIDGGKSHYRDFWDRALSLVRPGSIIVCDNVLMEGRTVSRDCDPYGRFITNIKKMRKFLDYLDSYEGANTSMLSLGDGITISVIK